jgi:hypothetical protein
MIEVDVFYLIGQGIGFLLLIGLAYAFAKTHIFPDKVVEDEK